MTTFQPRMIAVEQEQLTSDDYYTSPWVFEKMEIQFDVDVCSPPGGIEWIPANRYFSMIDDGLAQPWSGRVWMNPPFSNIGPWVRKFIEHENGICLTIATKSLWFFELWESNAAMMTCGPELSKFVGPKLHKAGDRWIPYPCVLWAFGQECTEAVSRIGKVR